MKKKLSYVLVWLVLFALGPSGGCEAESKGKARKSVPSNDIRFQETEDYSIFAGVQGNLFLLVETRGEERARGTIVIGAQREKVHGLAHKGKLVLYRREGVEEKLVFHGRIGRDSIGGKIVPAGKRMTLRKIVSSRAVTSGSFKCNVRFPVFYTFDPDLRVRLNSFFKGKAVASCVDFIKRYRAFLRNEPQKPADQLSPPWSYAEWYSIEFISPKLLSILFSVYLYEGGVHGNYRFVTYNLELSGGSTKEVALEDLFAPTEIRKVEKLVRRKLKDAGAGALEKNKKMRIPVESTPFTLSQEGVTFHFAPYEVGSYAEGAYEAVIELGSLRGMMSKRVLELLLDIGAPMALVGTSR